jgi:hypothetical protein
VKQLLDDDAVNVAFGDGIDSTVKRMGQLKRPAETGPTRQKKERRVYRLWAIFDSILPSDTSPGVKLGYKTEDNDNDIHREESLEVSGARALSLSRGAHTAPGSELRQEPLGQLLHLGHRPFRIELGGVNIVSEADDGGSEGAAERNWVPLLVLRRAPRAVISQVSDAPSDLATERGVLGTCGPESRPFGGSEVVGCERFALLVVQS